MSQLRQAFVSRGSGRPAATLERCARICMGQVLARYLAAWRKHAVAFGGVRPAEARPEARYDAARVLRRASAQESAFAEVKAEREALRALLNERDKALALTQRQLAHQIDRRRVADAASRQAQEQSTRLQGEAGKHRAQGEVPR